MIEIFLQISFILCLIPTLLSIDSILKFGIKPFCMFQIIFFVIFVLPIALDLTFGFPKYYDYPGFRDSNNLIEVNIIYCIFIIFISYFHWIFRGKSTISIKINSSLSKIDFFLLLILISPLLALIYAPDLTFYKSYDIDKPFTIEVILFHNIVSILTILSVTVGAYLIAKLNTKYLLLLIAIIVIVFLDFWLNAKRAIVIIFIIIFSSFYWLKNRSLKSLFLIFTLLVGFSLFNNWYQSTVRDYGDKASKEDNYENFRIDYFRDQRIKMVIYSKLYPQKMSILNYPGQSFVFDLTFFIPRTFWVQKPYPYAVYFTSAIYNYDAEPIGWGMTTSIYDELIANFNFISILFFEVFMIILFNKIFKLSSNYYSIYITFLVILAFMVQIAAFIILYFIAIIWYFKLSRISKNSKVNTVRRLSGFKS